MPKSFSFLLCCVSNCDADKHNGVVNGLHIVGGIVWHGKNNRSFNYFILVVIHFENTAVECMSF
jgi:hypothetical protein